VNKKLIVGSLLTFLLANHWAVANDQVEKAEAAASKAEVLEQKAAVGKHAPRPLKSETLTKPEVQAVDPAGEEPLDETITCLARTIYWESKGENSASMEAVANVVMNRLGNKQFPDTVCGIVKQGSEEGACQFSWWCDGRPDDVKEDDAYAAAKEVARKALNRQLPDRTGGALFFHQKTVKPDWSAEFRKTAEVGDFHFYKPAPSP